MKNRYKNNSCDNGTLKGLLWSMAIILFLLLDVLSVNASTVVVVPGNGSTSGNGMAPQGSRRFVNVKYIITSAEMTASGFSGPVNSVGWRWNVPMPPAAGHSTYFFK